MSLTDEIEESLQICRELEERLAEEGKDLHSLDHTDNITGFDSFVLPETEPVLAPESAPEIKPAIEPEKKITEEKKRETETKKRDRKDREKRKEGRKEKEKERETTGTGKHSMLRIILSVVVCIFAALVLSLVITRYVAHHTSVEGSSMEPSLSNGDQLIVENISYHFSDPERFDVVVFPNKDGVNYVKRIIGLPGEAVWIFDGQIYINGELLIEDYGEESIENPGMASAEITLGKQEYFVLGDNRNASIDSRQEEVGTVKRKDIKGKAWFRFWPFRKMGPVR